jgi:hypothetical protein
MSRTLEWGDDALVLHLTGLTSAAALKRTVEIPYRAINKVTVQNFDAPLLAFRIGTSSADIREGRFLLGSGWCFISYENHRDVVVLELTGHEFAQVIFQIDDPEEVSRLLLDRMSG